MTYNIGDVVRAPSSTRRVLRNNIPPEVGDLFQVTDTGRYYPRGVAVSGQASNDGRPGDHWWSLDTTWEVVTPAGAADRPFAVGDRVRYHTSVPPGGSFNWNRDRAGWTGTIETMNTSTHFGVRWDNGNGLCGASSRNLELIEETDPATTTPVTETLDSVWGVGNTIEFTVTGEFNGTHINVGCQSIRLVDARRTNVLRTIKSTGDGSNWNITFRVKIEDDWRITHPGGSFSKTDLRTHGRDFKLIEKAPEPVAPVTVEMSVEELSAVAGALGLLAAGGPTSGVWSRMDDLLKAQPSRPGDLYKLVDVSSGQDLYGPRLVRR